MKKLTAIILGLMFVMAYSVTPATFADEGQPASVSPDKVKALEDKVDSLERLVRTMEGHISSAPGKNAMVTTPSTTGEQEAGLIHTMQDIHMGGYIDVQYNQSLDRQTVNAAGNSTLRTFDEDQNTFSLNAAVLEFEKVANEEGGVGFRFDLAGGENAEEVEENSAGTDADNFSVQQLYAQIVAPLSFFSDSEIFGDTIDIRVGRQVTLAGTEVIRSPDNWNISRSFLFGLAIPFTHTGARAIWKLFGDKVTTYWGINNGWDNTVDNNLMKTIETGFSVNPLENVTWTSVMYWGPENANQGGHRRFLWTNVANWKVTDKLSLIGEIDFGSERRVAGLEGHTFENAQWHGYAAYARYQFNDKWAGVYRFEVLGDDDQFRTNAGATVDENVFLYSHTVTLERLIYDSMIARLEYRYDKNDERQVFDTHSDQQTIGAQLIYEFA